MLIIFSVLLTLLVIPIKEPMLRLFGASDVTWEYTNSYFSVYIIGTIFALLSQGMNQFIICQGFSKVGMKSVLIGAILNIILDPVFIFAFHMGVAGAAVATVISQFASCIFVLRFLFGDKAVVKIGFGGYSLKIARRILTIGLTPFLIIAIDNVMIIAMNAILQKYGGASQGDILVTCATIAQSFMLVVTMPLGGITGGTQTILAFNYGAKRIDRVKKAEKYIMIMSAIYCAILFVIGQFAGIVFVRLFTSDLALAGKAVRAIRICTLALMPLSVQYVLVDGLTGLGKVKYSLSLSMFRKALYFIALFLFPFYFGAGAAFYATPFSDTIGAIVTLAVYWFGMKKILAYEE